MDIEKLCSDAKLIGWSPETTIKHLHDLAEHMLAKFEKKAKTEQEVPFKFGNFEVLETL